MGYIIKTLIIECIMILIFLAEPVKCIKKISSVYMRIVYCIIIVLIAIELYPLIELFTKKTPENKDCYKEKAYELSSLSGLSCIILDDYDNIYCFYGYDDCLAVYDKNLNLKHAYYLPYSSNGRSTVAFIDGEVMVENRLNTIYTYKNGEYFGKIESNNNKYDDCWNTVQSNEVNSTEVTDKEGNVYSINTLYPSIYKNGEKKVGVTLLEWLVMPDMPALAIFMILLLLLGFISSKLKLY